MILTSKRLLCAAGLAGFGLAGVAVADTSIATFDNFTPNALYSSWSSGTTQTTATNYSVTATGYGSLWKQVGPINGTGNTNLVLDIDLSGSTGADTNLGVIVDLKDADDTQISYRFYGRSRGHHILVANLFTTDVPATDNGVAITNNLFRIITNNVGTTAGLDLGNLWHLNLEMDPYMYTFAPYTITFNDLKLANASGGSSGGGGGPTNVCAVISSFDNTGLGGTYGAWSTQTTTPTNLQITAAGWGGGYAAVSPAVNTTSNKTIQLNVTLTAPAAANGTLGPIVVLEDGDGTQIRFTWYGQNPGTNIVLTNVLSAGTIVQAGSTPGFDFSHIAFFHVQLDPSSYSGSYTVSWNDLSIVGCNGSSTGNGLCGTVSSFDNVYMAGQYGSWAGQTPTSTASNWQITATSGFGGAYNFISPAISTTTNRTLTLNVTLTAPAAANGQLGPIVVLEDGDGTQLRYAWYGQSPGTNLVLTSLLSAGVLAQAGSTPGFDASSITAFHIQVDPSGYSGAYTASFNDISIFGCDAVTIQITSYSYDPANQQFTLSWSSQAGATYAIQSSSDLQTAFSDVATGIPSGGTTTSVIVPVPDPSKGFFRVRKQ
jgi:hypothetical protein